VVPLVSRAPHPSTDLKAIALGLAASASAIALDEHDDTRRFARVLATPQYDAWVIRWSASAILDLHDHGGSWGVVHVVDGELVEVRVDLLDPRRPRTTRTVRGGQTIRISPATVHAVANTQLAEALSVHVYSPPLSSMNFYDLGSKGRIV
jgi:predicted metal-dependent enzyme (double-stranded beta helix superfamily)